MTELSSSFEDAWAKFQELESLQTMQETLEWEWARGRADYLAFLVTVEEPAAQQHIRRLLRATRGLPGIEVYGPSYWHITVKGVGFQVDEARQADEVAAGDIEGIAASAGDALAGQPAFEVRLGLPNAFSSVVFLEVWDEGQRLAALNARLIDEIPGLPRYQYDTPNFLPHISIARFASSEGLAQLREELARLRQEPPGLALRIAELQLIRARLAEEPPSFELLASYPLAYASGE